MNDYALARRNMIEGQLRPNRVDDPRVVAAFEAVPRELFLPKKLQPVAYNDEDVRLGGGRHLIEPLALARMVQYGGARPDDVALVLGCDTGYAAAILARLVATVFLVVDDESARAAAEGLLEGLEVGNVVVQIADPRGGLKEQGPFDLILLAGSVPEVPEDLLGQLEEGGRLVAVVQPHRLGRITIVTKVGAGFGRQTPFDAAIPAMPQFCREPGFVF
ncbi:MAG: protein-L-isoaspartate O-methyltransferase [Geminicoccaceae bacterium]|nr:protein-L-isoaspartate O-methyltransferase [Geminicoccaceae bacterium]